MIGPVAVRIADAPREATLGIDVDFTFPDVELGIVFRTLGMLEGFRESPLLPKDIAGGHLLRLEPTDERPAADERAAAAFVATVLAELNGATELRFSDHHLGAHFAMANDGADQLVAIAHATRAKGAAIADAIARLPFPAAAAASQAAWQAAAAEQGAVLVPTGPSLHGLAFRARVVDGQERVIGASIRTVWTKTGPTTRVELDLRDAQLPKAAWSELEGEVASDRLRGVRATFPTGHVLPEGAGATLERPEWTPDPRALLPALELFVGWVLDARGERRADQPYR